MSVDDAAEVHANLSAVAARMASDFERERKISTVYESMIRGLYLDEVLDEIYDSFHDLIPYDRMGCALLKPETSTLVARWGRSRMPRMRLRPGYVAELSDSLAGVMRSGKPRIISDLGQYLAAHPDSKSSRLVFDEGIRSSLTCPMEIDGRPLGFLFFSSAETNTYNEIHQETFLRLAAGVARLIERSQLYEELAALNRELTEARDLLRQQASHDDLTGVWNRPAILANLETRLRQARRQRRYLVLGMLDIDHFKRVNDTYGHQVGDDVLAGVAVLVKGVLRAGDEVGRYGGEEFLVVADVSTPDEAWKLGERIRSAIELGRLGSSELTDNEPIRVTASMGLALSRPRSTEGVRELIRHADAALYEAKNLGRNRVVLAPRRAPGTGDELLDRVAGEPQI